MLLAHCFSVSILSCAQIERRMELVRVVSHNTHKRMVSCLQGHIGADAEKRHVRPLDTSHPEPNWSEFSCVNQLKPDQPTAAAAGSPAICWISSSTTNLWQEFELTRGLLSVIYMYVVFVLCCSNPHTHHPKKRTTVCPAALYRKRSGKKHRALPPTSLALGTTVAPFPPRTSVVLVYDAWHFGLLGLSLGRKKLHRMWSTLSCFAQMCQLWK